MVEIGSQFSYFASRITGRQHQLAPTKRTFGQAFGVESYAQLEGETRSSSYAPRTSYDEDIWLTPYNASALDLSYARSHDALVGYRPEESTLAARI